VLKRVSHFLLATLLCIVKCPYNCATCPYRVCCRTAHNRRLTILYVVTFFLILPYLCSNLKYSVFYSIHNETQAKDFLVLENSKRLGRAEEYFKMLYNSNAQDAQQKSVVTALVDHDRTSAPITVALTVITISRNRHKIDSYEPKYLTQAVWRFLTLLDDWKLRMQENSRLKIQLSICNVDHDPTTYREALWIGKFVPVFQRFQSTHFSVVHVLEKEKQDYVFCLNQSLADGVDYVFLVEDDAMPVDDVFDVLQHVVSMHIEHRHSHGDIVEQNVDNLVYVKFYHPERLLNFISLDPERLPELFAYTVILASTLTAFCVLCFHVDSVNVLWRRLTIFSLLVVLTVGRPGVGEWRRIATPNFYSVTPAPSCCTPAMLFPRSGAEHVVRFLNASSCENNIGKDTLLDRMIIEKHLKAYLVQPNTFTHIGMYSSLREKLVDPFLV
jgi:hypothetical protein